MQDAGAWRGVTLDNREAAVGCCPGFLEGFESGEVLANAYTVGTRGSALALAQTAMVMGDLLRRIGGLELTRQVVRTSGDQNLDVPLSAVGAEGVFVKELEHALLTGEIDLAVHSLKDLPTASDPRLAIAAILPRADCRDALIAPGRHGLSELADGSVIGTGSLRRRAQLVRINPTWRFKDIRGNLDTRLAKLRAGDYDAVILACAGLDRLGRSHVISERLPYSAVLPAPGQGAIAVQIRAQDSVLAEIVGVLDDPATRKAVEAERALLAAVGGGCLVPLGAHAELHGDHLVLDAVLASEDGSQIVRGRMEGPGAKPRELGAALGADLMERGGKTILAQLRLPEPGKRP